MKLDQVRENICRHLLRPGQVKRIPVEADRPLCGYCIACPRCGRVNFVTPIHRDIVRETGGVLNEAEFVCDGCHEHIHVSDGEFG